MGARGSSLARFASKIAAALVIAVVAFSALLWPDAARAQSLRTFVSSTGSDSNPCTRTQPCQTLLVTFSKTADGGEINCLDSGPYSGVAINKSVTIDCSETGGMIQVSGSTAMPINSSANSRVVLRGLTFSGFNAAANATGLGAVDFALGTSLRIEDCFIHDFTNTVNPGTGNGIKFAPTSGSPELTVINTHIIRNGVKTLQGNGILIAPTGSAGARVSIVNSTIDDNEIGIRADSTLTTGNISVAITNTSLSMNRGGLSLSGDATGSVTAAVIRSVITHGALGMSVVAPAIARVGDSIIAGNTTGISGNVFSYGNNQLDGNTTRGSVTPVGLQSLP